jgi:hypothetical protein
MESGRRAHKSRQGEGPAGFCATLRKREKRMVTN